MENGQRVRRDRQVKLALIAEHRPKADGSAPDSVRSMVVNYLAPINAADALRYPPTS